MNDNKEKMMAELKELMEEVKNKMGMITYYEQMANFIREYEDITYDEIEEMIQAFRGLKKSYMEETARETMVILRKGLNPEDFKIQGTLEGSN